MFKKGVIYMAVITGYFNSSQQAVQTAEYLRTQGFKGEISVVGPHNEEVFRKLEDNKKSVNDISSMANYGVVGGLVGLSVGLASFFVLPGIGQLIALGPIAGLIGGASGGALGGQLIGALNRSGASEQEGEELKRIIELGNTVILIKSGENEELFVKNTLRDNGAHIML